MKATTERQKAKDIIDTIQTDPVWYTEKILGETLWGKEKEILTTLQTHDDVTVKSCHASGKTFTAARAALWFFSAYSDSIVISTAPTFNQVKNQLWRELNQAVSSSKIKIPKANKTSLEADKEWYALGMSTDNTDNFQGFHAKDILAIIDEASGVSEEIFEAVNSVLTSQNAKRLYIGNPLRRSGEFFRSHNDTKFERISISVYQTPNFTKFGITEDDILEDKWQEKVDGELPYPELVTPKWTSKYIDKHPKGSTGYDIKILGEFPESAEDTFISRKLVEQAIKTEVEPKENDPVQLGVDPARFGSDQTGFCLRKGPKVLKLWQRPITNEMEVAGETKNVITRESVDKVKMDTTGVGAGAYDRLVEQQIPAELVEFKGGEKANDSENYRNKAAEAWGVIKDRLQGKDIDLLDNDDLSRQLSTRRFSFTSRGQIKLESKKDMKKRGLPSPDLADAVGYAFYDVDNGFGAKMF